MPYVLFPFSTYPGCLETIVSTLSNPQPFPTAASRKPNPRTTNTSTNPTPQKYCSDRCRRERPSSKGSGIETVIETTFVKLLGEGSVKEKIVDCGEVERIVFASQRGEGNEKAETEMREKDEISSDESGDDDEGGGVLLLQQPPSPNSLSAKDAIPLSPQAQGLKVAREREKVRQAARRGVVFGFCVGPGGEEGVEGDGYVEGRRRVEAVQNGRVVEASFAKGDWGVRWREEVGG